MDSMATAYNNRVGQGLSIMEERHYFDKLSTASEPERSAGEESHDPQRWLVRRCFGLSTFSHQGRRDLWDNPLKPAPASWYGAGSTIRCP